MFGAIEETAQGTRENLNKKIQEDKSAFSLGIEQAELSLGEGVEEQAYDQVFSMYDDYKDNKQYYDAVKDVSIDSNWIFGAKGMNKARYLKSIEHDEFKLDFDNNVVLGSNGFMGIELLYDMDAIKGLLLAQKQGFSELTLKTAYSEITKAKSQEIAQQLEGKSLWGQLGGVIAGHVMQPETSMEVALSPAKVAGQGILKTAAKAFGVEALAMTPGEIARERRTREHMENAGLEYGLWDSVQNILIAMGIGGFIRSVGSGIVDANTARQINKRLDNPTDKAIVNRFFQRQEYKLTADTNKHIALVEKSLADMNANRPVDVAQHTDIDINAKTDPNVEEISLDDELTKADMDNGYQDEVQGFENEWSKAEPIPEEAYNGDIRPDQELDTYAGMATKEEGDELIAEMAELDPEIKAELDEIQNEMSGIKAKAFGGDPVGGALGGGFFGGTEGIYEEMVEGKDLTTEDYLARIGAGVAIGAGLGAKYGGKGGSKAFAGEAKKVITDKSGNPLTLYHGTNIKSIEKLKVSKPRDARGNIEGIYFTSDKSEASEYGSNIHSVNLLFENPFHGDPLEYYAKKYDIIKPSFGSKKEVWEKWKEVTPEKAKQELINDGYDSVIRPREYEGTPEYIAFTEDQIKKKD